jgi:hypothetical protein
MVGVYLVIRALAEPFVIGMSDLATYRIDWGGLGLAGALAVHRGRGIIVAVLLGRALVGRPQTR